MCQYVLIANIGPILRKLKLMQFTKDILLGCNPPSEKKNHIEICADQLRQLGDKISLKSKLEQCVSVPTKQHYDGNALQILNQTF